MKNILIIGGGLAGLTAAIHLSKNNIAVTLLEKAQYPRHKVCGEYVSNEVRPYLEYLGIDFSAVGIVEINALELSTANGQILESKLPLGGFGISRYALDQLLYQKAVKNGCRFVFESAEEIEFTDGSFRVTTAKTTVIEAEFVLGAFGKRSNIDQKMQRPFIGHKSPWLAVKAHYRGAFPDHLVGLHHFEGGYCGVSKVENDVINICYLADYATFKQYKNIEAYQNEVLCKNPHLKEVFENSTVLFGKPLTISQVSFEKKQAIENHIIMIGDAAGLIHPLCGNGMAMAIHSAKIAAEILIDHYSSKSSREITEKRYQKEWDNEFRNRINTGSMLAAVLRKPILSAILLRLLVKLPAALSLIIRKTHGKYLTLGDGRN